MNPVTKHVEQELLGSSTDAGESQLKILQSDLGKAPVAAERSDDVVKQIIDDTGTLRGRCWRKALIHRAKSSRRLTLDDAIGFEPPAAHADAHVSLFENDVVLRLAGIKDQASTSRS